MRQPTANVAALMMVRNEQDVIATCIGHLFSLGVDRIYVTDNGSSDATPEILRQIAIATGRLEHDSDPGEYWQADVLTSLARRAAANGADWVLPTDADEFLWLDRTTSLADLCSRTDIGGYRLSVCNFMQARFLRRGGPGSVMTMCVSARPTGSVASAQAAVTRGEIPFVRMVYPTKLLVRATPSLRIAFGHHDASETLGPLVPLERGELLHAPIRSFQHLLARIDTGRRVQAVTPAPDQNWHLKRIAAMDQAALEVEWRRNTYSPFWPIHRQHSRLDLRLSAIGRRQAGFRRRFGPR